MRGLHDAPNRLKRMWAEGPKDADTHFRGFHEHLKSLKAMGIESLNNSRMLEVGCGDRAGLSLLCAQGGASVDAIDILPVRLGVRRPTMWMDTASRLGPGAAIKQVVRDHLHTWRYWKRLRQLSGAQLPFGSVRFQRMDASNMTFPSDSFDIVCSSAVWEHIADVEAATREVNRVLAPGGIGWIGIHLFPGITGGHDTEWSDPIPGLPRTLRPWDHLRKDSRTRRVYLNGWSETQYRRVFEQETSVQRWEDGEHLGQSYLTPAIREELPEYSERDLLLSSVTVWIRKKR